ncbi:transcriptional-regulating factor 1 isoform X8 [Cricetulus griseus]|uniref:Transcriptional-regulating factor 1 isoform X8 n=1 Tax=Cricetulus griseus TaxID=10029 RepID=A0A9J7J8M7_CRIGR|nr:transcriptional-regulating factor 1 isoform X8 [Cricetulus griseus]XP_027244946.1 transcriptional-regulating factor 1 isoform X8 [Cricetulus griseus]
MGDQQLYKTNHVAHGGENLFYQQPPLGVHSGLNHSYGNAISGAGMDAPQASPVSPHFPQDTRDSLGLPIGSKNLGQIDTSRQGGWGSHAGPGNHVQLRSNLASSNMMWGAPAQVEPSDGYQYTYSQASEIRTQKLTSGVLHKLDSFTQVFANQNLRIQVNNMAQVLHTQSAVMDGAPDSALRQLLSQKPVEPSASAIASRYQQVPQQPHPGFTGGLPKPALPVGQHAPQGHLYYDYQQPLAQMSMQGGQPLQAPQVLSSHMQPMQQHQYYPQPPPQQQQAGLPRISIQEMQQQPQQQIRPSQPQQQQQQLQLQQRQGSLQIPQYYQPQPMMQHLQEQQQPPMHLQPPSYHRDPHQYPPEQAHAVQLIQLGSMPQYYYQEPQQPYSHPLYQQSHLSQHQQREDSQLKTYSSDRQTPAMLSSHGDMGPPDAGVADPASSEMTRVSSTLPHQPLLSPSGIHLNNMGPPHPQPSPSAMWPQMHLPDGRAQPGSPESSSGQTKGAFGEQFDAKNKLTCSICLKEFKSLPALNGHMRSHGGMRASPSLKQEEGEKAPPPPPQPQPQPPLPPPPPPPPLPPEAERLTPMVMPVSVPVKLLPPKPSSQGFTDSVAATPSARDKPASSMSDDEMPVLVRMTLSPPHSPQGAAPCAPAEIPRKHHPAVTAKVEEPLKTLPEKKKFRHRPEPLFIPPPPSSYTPNPTSYSGATLYQSQLRSPRILGDHLLLDPAHELPPYTPPPMLSPVRQGSGLFSNVLISGHGPGVHPQLPLTPLTPTPRVLLCRSSSIDGSNVTVTPGPGEQTVDVEPRINIGLRFQAEIPELQDVSALAQDTHKATLVWKPWPELENQALQQQVENLLNLCCSSALPGGGTNSEFALHSLFEAKGDVMATLEMLLLRKPVRLKCHPLANYHYAGSDKWTSLERKLFNKALATYSKDFIFVQKMVKSKTVAQCVEYYYTWKKIMRLGRRHRTRLAEIIDDCMVFSSRQALNGHARIHGGTNQVTKTRGAVPSGKQKPGGTQSGYCSVKSSPSHSTTSGETDPTTIFPCKECGKVFFKIKSRNAHMKTHRQQEEQQRQKAQKAAFAAEMAATIERTTGPVGAPELLPLDQLSLMKPVKDVDILDDDVVQQLGAMDEAEVVGTDLLLDDQDSVLLQGDTEL